MKSIFLGAMFLAGSTVFAADFCVLYFDRPYDHNSITYNLVCTDHSDDTTITKDYGSGSTDEVNHRYNQVLAEGKLEALQHLTERNYTPYGEDNIYIRR